MKKLVSAFAAIIIGLCLFCGCGEIPPQIEEKPFYTLAEAYNYGWFTKKEIKKIVNMFNEPINLDELDGNILETVKQNYCEEIKQTIDPKTEELMFPYAKVEDIQRIEYYGEYNDCYCFRIWHPYADAADVELEKTVAGITYYYTSPDMCVWKNQ